MIDYELAKRLEDAGFLHALENEKGHWRHDHTTSPARHYYVPTLSELIEACDDEKFILIHDEDGWYAENKPGMSPSDCKSPEEAVAELWLALHEDQKPPRRADKGKGYHRDPKGWTKW